MAVQQHRQASRLLSLVERIYLFWLKRDEMENTRLRAYFRNHFDIDIGLYSYGCFDRWRVPPSTRIGRYCSVARSARLMNANHPISYISTHPYLYDPHFGLVGEHRISQKSLVVEDDVWIGHNAIITPGCGRIGRGAVVGAGAIVTKDVPPYAIVVGSPARIVRFRFDPKTIAAIESTQWWSYDRTALAELIKTFPSSFFNPSPDAISALTKGTQ